MKKPFSYETIRVGEELGRKEVLITDEMIRACAYDFLNQDYLTSSQDIILERYQNIIIKC